jgi:hypothetical protein
MTGRRTCTCAFIRVTGGTIISRLERRDPSADHSSAESGFDVLDFRVEPEDTGISGEGLKKKIHRLICNTFAGGKPLKQVDEAME